ncbi:MAG: transglutaminase family protein [Myxococcales bacterium]|jgi:regulator of sirC expression with transglutaminase-like and TPR domain
MVIDELWSQRDAERLSAFELAVALDDLPGGLFAIEGISKERAAEGVALLEGWAALVRARLGQQASPREQAIVLGELLGGELGFRLDEGGRPDGVRLYGVLTRRKGRPTILTAIWLEVARRAGLAAQAKAFGGRLLVEIGEESPVLVDPAAGGRLVEPVDAIGGGRGAPHSVSIEDLFAGTLDFLAHAHMRRGDPVSAFRAVSLRCALVSQAPLACLQRAMLAEQLGAIGFAAELYEQLTQRFPGTEVSLAAASKLNMVRARGPLLLQ